jgi:glycerate kinase
MFYGESMKIVIAPDSFKESLGAPAVARAIEAGFRQVFADAEYLLIPVADGGEGTVETLVAATGGRFISTAVHDPLGKVIEASYGVDGNNETAYIEMAAASGLELIPPGQRNPLLTGSYGTGEMILDALRRGFRHLILGIGGSATNDGGAGMLQALGMGLFDANGTVIAPGGGSLGELAEIDTSGLAPELKECRIQVACDVNNPLTGERGASAVFGPQKGADPAMVEMLDRNLTHWADLIEREIQRDVRNVAGAGAAGGMGVALLAFLGAELQSGSDIVLQTVQLEQAMEGADLVITGEGRIDGQSIAGKTPVGVTRLANQKGIPVIAMAGCLGEGAELVLNHGVTALFPILPGLASLEDTLVAAEENLRTTARNIAAILNIRG